MTMEVARLGKSDLYVSRIGIGTWQASYKQWGDDVEDKKIIEALKRSFELGVNFVDTAELYGNGHSERVVGSVVKSVDREKVIIATKVYGPHLRYDELIKSAQFSLNRLGIEYLDLYQIHWPDPWEQIPLRETMKAMERLYEDGKIRAIGVSNFSVRDLQEAESYLSKCQITSNQVRYNMIQREVEEEVIPYCRRNNIAILAWSPIAQGVLTGKYSAENIPKDRVRRENKLFKRENLKRIENLISLMSKLAIRHKKTITQVALNWLLKDRDVIPIPGAKTKEQAEENAGSANWNLDAKEFDLIAHELADMDIDYM